MKKRRPLVPRETEWLFSCPNSLRTSQIVSALQAENHPLTVFSARHWQETWRVGNDVLREYGFPESSLYQPGQQVGWHTPLPIGCSCEDGMTHRGTIASSPSRFWENCSFAIGAWMLLPISLALSEVSRSNTTISKKDCALWLWADCWLCWPAGRSPS